MKRTSGSRYMDFGLRHLIPLVAIKIWIPSFSHKMMANDNNSIHRLYVPTVQIMDNTATAEDIQKALSGVDAVTDLPGNILWEQLHQAFPDAKVSG